MSLWDKLRRKRPEEAAPSAVADGDRAAPAAPRPPAAPPAVRAALAVDHLMLLHPEGWGRLEIVVSIVSGAPRVERVDVEPAAQPIAPAALHVDRGLRTAWLAEELALLFAGLGEALEPAATANVVVTRRGDERAEVVALGQPLAVPLAGLVGAPALLRLLDGHGAAMEARQAALARAVEAWGRWTGWDRDGRRIAFEDAAGVRRELAAEVLGSFSPAESSWCWAWANRSFPPPLVAASAGVRDAAPELPIVARGGFRSEPAFAYTAAMVAGHLLGERAVYRFAVPRTGVELFFAVDVPAAG